MIGVYFVKNRPGRRRLRPNFKDLRVVGDGIITISRARMSALPDDFFQRRSALSGLRPADRPPCSSDKIRLRGDGQKT